MPQIAQPRRTNHDRHDEAGDDQPHAEHGPADEDREAAAVRVCDDAGRHLEQEDGELHHRPDEHELERVHADVAHEVDGADGERHGERERDPELARVVDRRGGQTPHGASSGSVRATSISTRPYVKPSRSFTTRMPSLPVCVQVTTRRMPLARRPRELGALEGGREAAAAPVAPHDGQPILRDAVLRRPAEARVADDLAVCDRDERAARVGRLVAQPVVQRDRDRHRRGHVRPAGDAERVGLLQQVRPLLHRDERHAGRRDRLGLLPVSEPADLLQLAVHLVEAESAAEDAASRRRRRRHASGCARSRARGRARRGGGAVPCRRPGDALREGRAARRCRSSARPKGPRTHSRRCVSPSSASTFRRRGSRSRRSRWSRAVVASAGVTATPDLGPDVELIVRRNANDRRHQSSLRTTMRGGSGR